MKVRRAILLIATLLLAAAACGGGDDDAGDSEGATPTNPPATEAPETPADSSDDPPPAPAQDDPPPATAQDDPPPAAADKEVGADGSFTVNGEVFAVTYLNRCIPFFDDPGNIDLQALSQGAPSAKLNLVLIGQTVDVSVDGSGINEMFGSRAFGSDPVVDANDIAGDRWTGSATVGDSLGSGSTVDLTWDVRVPDEAIDCSL